MYTHHILIVNVTILYTHTDQTLPIKSHGPMNY